MVFKTKHMLLNIIRRLARVFYKSLAYLKVTHPSVIVMVDGGLCSQMHQYMIGQDLRSKGKTVEYDLSFYKKGLDLEGKSTRHFLLEKLFPNAICNKASSVKICLYKRFFRYNGKHPQSIDLSWLSKDAPVYLGGYYSDIDEMYKVDGLFNNLFSINFNILSPASMNVLNKIRNSWSVGVHIRRGDLKSYNVSYGHPVTLDYLREGFSFFLKQNKQAEFFIFSDEREYVKEEVIPSLGFPIRYWLSDSGVDNVYEDFILLSQCKNLITSKGTMGKYAAVYNNALTVIVSNDDNQTYIVDKLDSKIIKL